MKKLKKILKRIFKPVILIYRELKKVEWLSLSQTIKATLLVLVISGLLGIIIVVFDLTFFKIREITLV